MNVFLTWVHLVGEHRQGLKPIVELRQFLEKVGFA